MGMRRKDKILAAAALVTLGGVAALLAAASWMLWRESIAAEQAYVGGLASRLGKRTEAMLLDTRDLLAQFNASTEPRCSPAHLKLMQAAAVSRPHIRAIGHWRAAERLCGVGFLQAGELKPAKADRIYESGLIAWWPSAQTEVGGVQLFLMRLGEHDVAIDPRQLLDLGPMQRRQAGLWVEGLRLAAVPWEADLPAPESVVAGVTLDQAGERVISRFTRNAVIPIDVVAIEPIGSFWARHLRSLSVGAAFALAAVLAWTSLIWRYSRRQLSLSAQLRAALAAGEIQAQYQPVVELGSGACVGAEALARWVREDGERVSPDVFIPVAEQHGLAHEVTLAVLRAILRDLGELLSARPGISINLNLSHEDLRDERFAQRLADALREARLPCGAIKLEITERALVNSDTSRRLIREFRARGHQVAVDDFGTGYSSLSYLATFELDVLKIDKSFVDAIGTGAATSQVAVHVIEMAKSLGLDCVAEGVQTAEQVEWLRQQGVRYGQGYLFSRPLPAADFIRLVEATAG